MSEAVLSQILATLTALQSSQQILSQKVEKMQVDHANTQDIPYPKKMKMHYQNYSSHSDSDGDTVVSPILEAVPAEGMYVGEPTLLTRPSKCVTPAKMNWGEADPRVRGPILVSRDPSSMNIRNAMGAYGGPYSIYRGLAVAMGDLAHDHKPNFENTQPPIEIKQQPQWSDPTKIVSLDPFGHLTNRYYKKEIDEGLDIRPTIAITRAHMLVPEIQEVVKNGGLTVDGKIVMNETGELNVHKAAIDPVWYLPGVAARLNVEEDVLRRSLFENSGGMYPELITRPDIKVFLPPIGGISIYIFGNHELLSDPGARLTVRVHDECNGSDVFCSDICTCRPYLIFGMQEAIKEAQNGGVGLIIYFRKEGRALGEVTKYLVYNARKREGDSAAKYFTRTENVAGVKDMRFQALMPDVLHWLGVTKIDRFTSMSNMKHDALIDAGIKILERVPIPDELIPPDSKVEMEAKIAAGYFTNGHVPCDSELSRTVGRGWDDFHS
ncbi:Uracil-regulated protein 1 [Mortierella sp. AD094]|nr:Uracil-regulated protein 1 [Mortierella sp. AD094]